MTIFLAVWFFLYGSFVVWSIYTGESWLEIFDETCGKPSEE